MKIKKLPIIILMTIIFIMIGINTYATTGIINKKTVELRKEPNSKKVLDYIYKGDKVEIIEQKNGWYKIKAITGLGKVTGYVTEAEVDIEEITEDNVEEPKTENSKPEETVPTQTTPEKPTVSEIPTISNIEENAKYTIQQEISIKILPLINSMEKAKITGEITVIEIINDWVRIENDSASGWIRKNTLKKSIIKTETLPENQEQSKPEVDPKPEEITTEKPQEEQPKEPEKTEINKIGYVNTEGLIVRKGPTTDSKEIDGLSKNDEVKIIGKEGNWYKIELDGKIGYVSAKYISDTKVPETTSRSGNTLKNENITNVIEEKQQQEETSQEKTNTTTTGAAVVEYAKQYLGYKYVSGGASPKSGFDCSGFTQYVYKNFGVSLNRTSSAQIKNGVAVDKNDLQLGDIVIFNDESNTKIGHVGIYIGDGNFIHASNPKDGVKITTLKTGYYKERYVGARRVI